jgi:hypothetical protein
MKRVVSKQMTRKLQLAGVAGCGCRLQVAVAGCRLQSATLASCNMENSATATATAPGNATCKLEPATFALPTHLPVILNEGRAFLRRSGVIALKLYLDSSIA